ncbi:MAG TPA: glycosyltransferase [Actinomycetales bacterium]
MADAATTGVGTATTTSVVVAVLTYRRPQDLAELLPLLDEQVRSLAAPARVVVVDNDPLAGARGQVEGGPATYVHEPRPGISAARNRALAEAAGDDVLVFIDDDERPRAGWLASLLTTRAATGAVAVVGPVVSQFDAEPTPWVAAGRFFDRRRLPTGSVLEVAATNNLLLDLRWLRAHGLVFDERFGISGGSDTLFTRQLVALGGRMVWCDEAVVVDRVPASRTTARWVLQRAFRSGNGWARTSLTLSAGPVQRLRTQAVLVARGGVRAVGGTARALLGVVSRDPVHQAKGVRTALRGAGMVSGAFGHVYSEYRRPPTPSVPA